MVEHLYFEFPHPKVRSQLIFEVPLVFPDPPLCMQALGTIIEVFHRRELQVPRVAELDLEDSACERRSFFKTR